MWTIQILFISTDAYNIKKKYAHATVEDELFSVD